MAFLLPLEPSIARYDFTLALPTPGALAGTPYIFALRWNSRDTAWYMDVSEIDETTIVIGLKLVLGTYIGRTVTHPLFTEGVFVAVDTTNQHEEATYDDMGTRVELWYYTAAEIAAAALS